MLEPPMTPEAHVKRVVLTIAAASLLGAPIQAQTNITQFATFSDRETVLYLPFAVLGSGVFEISTSFGVPLVIDPHIRLYRNACTDGACLGAGIGSSNNSGFLDLNVNSYLSVGLAAGEYTVAMSVWDFTDAEARAGNAGFDDTTGWFSIQPTNCDDVDALPCFYRTTIASETGVAVAQGTSVPEPVSALLLGTGLLGLAFVRRREQDGEDA